MRPMKKLQLTSRSFTTIEPDESEERRSTLRHSHSHSAEATDRLDIPTFTITKPSTRPTPIGRTPITVDQSDEATQTDVSMVDEESLLSALRLHRPTYSTSLYVDSFTPTVNVPLHEDTEVMLLLDGSHIKSRRRTEDDSKSVPEFAISSQPQNDGGNQKRFLSTVDVQSTMTADGHLILTPVSSRSVELTQGDRSSEVMERSSEVTERSSEVVERSSDHREQIVVAGRRHRDFVVHRRGLDSVSCSVLFHNDNSIFNSYSLCPETKRPKCFL